MDEPKIGPTGDFPRGKPGNNDEGGIVFGIGADLDNHKVVINFGASVHWVAMEPEGAEEMAELLKKNARIARAHKAPGGSG